MVVDSVQLAHRPAGSRGRARTPFRAFGATPLRSDHRLTRGVKKPMLWAPPDRSFWEGWWRRERTTEHAEPAVSPDIEGRGGLGLVGARPRRRHGAGGDRAQGRRRGRTRGL